MTSEPSIIEQLQKNERPFGLMSEEMQEKAREIGKHGWERFFARGNGTWGEVDLTNRVFLHDTTYRLRSDYTDIKWPDKVFASTTDSEKDSMNNVIGVTAHCKCGNMFCDDVVHGKSQRKADYAEKPEIVECEIISDDDRLWFQPPDIDAEPRDLICDASRYSDFIGFKFMSGQVELTPIVFKGSCSTKSICQFRDLADLEILHATSVLFRRQK